MVNLEELRVRGLRAYETGRVRAASRIVWLVLPVAAVCLIESRGREACVCFTSLLIPLAIWLRWRNRQGTEAVTAGLLAGSFPLVAGLVAARLGLHCGAPDTSSLCTALSLLVGGVAGVFIALREIGFRARALSWFTAGCIAALAAGLGCVRLGVLGVAGVALGIALGATVTGLTVRRSV